MMSVEHTISRPQQITLGTGETVRYAVADEFISRLKGIPKDERLFAPSKLEALEVIFKQRCAEKKPLYVFANSIISYDEIQLSLWSADKEVTRILRRLMKSLMIELYRAINAFKVKADDYEMTPSQYNMENGELLFGAELTIPLLSKNVNYIVDVKVSEVKEVAIGLYNSEALSDVGSISGRRLFFQSVGSDAGLSFEASEDGGASGPISVDEDGNKEEI